MPPYGPIKINQQIEVEFVTNEAHKHRTKVENVADNYLEILSPMEKGEVVHMSAGMSVKVTYSDEVAIYSFHAPVIRQDRGGFSTVKLGTPANFTRIQRRNFVRIDTSIGVAAKIKQKVETEQKIEARQMVDSSAAQEIVSGVTMDLSGGGLMFRCNELMSMGDLIEIEIFLDDRVKVHAIGRVVRFQHLPAHLKYKYAVGLEFTQIVEKERDKIIKYIFKKQLELRKKGLL